MQDRNTNDVSTNTIDLSKKDVEENAQAVNKEIKIAEKHTTMRLRINTDKASSIAKENTDNDLIDDTVKQEVNIKQEVNNEEDEILYFMNSDSRKEALKYGQEIFFEKGEILISYPVFPTLMTDIFFKNSAKLYFLPPNLSEYLEPINIDIVSKSLPLAWHNILEHLGFSFSNITIPTGISLINFSLK